jgi:beta-glucosidase
VTAIIAAHLPGQEIGNAIVDIVYGAVNPSAKLPYTIGPNESDYNAPIVNVTATTPVTEQDQNAWQSTFTGGLMIDYRHFDSANITPRYGFGFGLSYTTFSVSDLSVKPLTSSNLTAYPPPESPPSPGGNSALYTPALQASVSVTNTGSVAGVTVPQLCLSLPQGSVPAGTPVQVLRGFDKVSLQPGASQVVTFELVRKDVSFWDVVAQDWKVPRGEMGLAVGLSSRDLQVRGTMTLI